MKTNFLWVAAAGVLFSGTPLVHAAEPLTVTESNGTTTPLSKEGLIDFLDDLQANPRDVTLNFFNHAFVFDTTTDMNGQAVAINFISAELGFDKSFTGADTGATIEGLKTFLKSDEFLGPFYRLLNSGEATGTYSGTPNGTIGSTAASAFGAVFNQSVQTSEEKGMAGQIHSLSVNAGLSKFDSDGFEGSSVKVSPAYGWTMGEKKKHRLNVTLPVERIEVEGFRTYRAGLITQFVTPVELPWEVIWKVAPDLSYSILGSQDIPSYSGTIGGGLTNTFGRDWGPWFGNVGLYYARFQNLGGIDTDLKANLYSYGLQGGRRIGKRWAVSGYGIGVSEDVTHSRHKNYQTVGAAVLYRIFNRFNLEVSVNKTFGIPGYSNSAATFGSAWNF